MFSQAEMSVDTSLLMAAADASWARNGFSDTTVLYGCSREDLVGVSTEAWLELLMRILVPPPSPPSSPPSPLGPQPGPGNKGGGLSDVRPAGYGSRNWQVLHASPPACPHVRPLARGGRLAAPD